tara:strand:- start:926 stop:2353 length:1428 start_codon:yes stop_codon:yes gene_type:complete
MATIIEQAPLYTTLPVGQDVIFSVSNNLIVSNQIKVKFIAEVHISSSLPPNTAVATDVIGTFKTTPNNAGVGMFDFRPIIESYVKTDNLSARGSEYKGVGVSTYPLHIIDKFSLNNNIIKYLTIQFRVQYLDQDPASSTYNELIQVQAENSDSYKIFNGYLKYNDVLDIGTNVTANDFGYNISSFDMIGAGTDFLTNAPTTQYANVDDYGVLPILASQGNTTLGDFRGIAFTYYNSSGVEIGSSDQIDRTVANGAYFKYNAMIENEVLYIGAFPGNLRNWHSEFRTLVDAGNTPAYYTVIGLWNDGSEVGESNTYTIYVNCPTLKGYEPIRLAWLNQWGAWDYYTFTMKSSRMLSTKGSTYNQLEGTWNEETYRIDGFKGGKKAFRVNATEKITMNTDFVNESESVWFEELINSPEVYMLKGYEFIVETTSALNQYIIPVRLTTSSYTRKTVANDKLMQYTFEVEKSKTLRTQSV